MEIVGPAALTEETAPKKNAVQKNERPVLREDVIRGQCTAKDLFAVSPTTHFIKNTTTVAVAQY